MPELANQCADEGAGEQSEQPEKQAHHRAHHGADQRLAAGTDPFCPEHGGEDVDHDRQGGQQPQNHEGDGANLAEVAGPGGQQHAREHQRDPRNGRQDQPGEAKQYQDHGDEVIERLDVQLIIL